MYNHLIALFLIILIFLTGCATQQHRDPLEKYNRAIFKFNRVTYDYVLIPAAKGYNVVVPVSFQTGVDNAYNNALEPGRMVNDLFQLNVNYFWQDTARFVANTIFGVFGLFDVAKTMGLPRRTQNFGFTLAYWGYRYSAYFVVPIFGPGTLGNSIGSVTDTLFNPLSYSVVMPAYLSWSSYGIYKLNQGVSYLPQYQKLINSAIDPYVAMRNAYLQNYDHEIDKTLQVKHSAPKQSELDNQAAVLAILGYNKEALTTESTQ